MKTFVNLFMLSGVIFLFSHSVNAQQPPYQFGDIPEDHLLMNEFPADTNATAVILFDYGEVHIERYRFVVFKRHQRIKILSAAGMMWGNHRIIDKSGAGEVRNVRGRTVNYRHDGTHSVHHLESDAIFDERVSDEISSVTFTMPALEPGSVIEYSYEVILDGPMHLPDWEFQTSEPVLWSEYNVTIPPNLEYVYIVHGYHRLDGRESGERTTRRADTERQRIYRWVMRDLPAIRDEPHITTLDDYIAKVTFQLDTFHPPVHRRSGYETLPAEPRRFLDTWEEVIRTLVRHREFGRQLSLRRPLRQVVSSLTDDISAPEQKLRTLYNYLRTSMVWDGRYRVLASDRLDRIYERKSGTSADIALLLVGMLQEAGIDAHPVILSTRDHGTIHDLYPMTTQFNHVIAYAEIDGEIYLLDATDPHCPVNVLPFNTLNERGLLIRSGEVTWIAIDPPAKYSKNISGRINLRDDASFLAEINVNHDGYGAVSARRRHRTQKDEEFLKSLLGKEEAVITVDSLIISGKDNIDAPFDIYLEVSSDHYILKTGEMLYFNPVIFDRIDENPFNLPDRTFPVDFGYPIETSVLKYISLPDGHEVVELPEQISLALPGESARYSRITELEDGIITFHRRFEVNKTIFSPDEYQRLRHFYRRIVEMDSEYIVLKPTNMMNGGND